MKKTRRAQPLATVAEDFVRGALVAGMLAAIQDRQTGPAPPSAMRLARLAVQGGAALAGGAAAARAVTRGDTTTALLALGAGTALVALAEAVLAPPAPSQEITDV